MTIAKTLEYLVALALLGLPGWRFAAAAESERPERALEAEPSERIVGWGDSIARLWLPALAALGFEVVSVAENGSTTRNWRPGERGGYFDRIPPHLPAAWCVVALGSNDSAVLGGVPAKFHRIWLEQVVRGALDAGCGTVQIVQPPAAPLDPARSRLLPQYRAAQRELCAEIDRAVCGPDLSIVLEWPDDLPDGLHPNERGTQKAARAVAEVIRTSREAPAR